MRRKLRWTFTIASGLLLVAALAGWIRSYFASDMVTIAIPRLNLTLIHGITDVERYVVVPLWFVATTSAGGFIVGARAIRCRTRANPTACKSCGYDLRAGHDKCPECGGESHVKAGDSDSTNTPSAPTVQR